eukprot:9056769-Pyramimonas_sp.AAC.1
MGYDTVPLAAVMWARLKRFACFLPQHPSTSFAWRALRGCRRRGAALRYLRGTAEGVFTVPSVPVMGGCL